jgi:hypothetical protein
MSEDTGTVNVYPQHSWHSMATIHADRAGLLALREAIDKAVETGEAEASVFASDGEGYSLLLRRMPDFGDKAWADYEPHYTMMEHFSIEAERDALAQRIDAAEAEAAALVEFIGNERDTVAIAFGAGAAVRYDDAITPSKRRARVQKLLAAQRVASYVGAVWGKTYDLTSSAGQ